MYIYSTFIKLRQIVMYSVQFCYQKRSPSLSLSPGKHIYIFIDWQLNDDTFSPPFFGIPLLSPQLLVCCCFPFIFLLLLLIYPFRSIDQLLSLSLSFRDSFLYQVFLSLAFLSLINEPLMYQHASSFRPLSFLFTRSFVLRAKMQSQYFLPIRPIKIAFF